MSTPSIIVFSLVAAFIPSLVYTLLIWWLDRYEREPLRLMVVAFLWGAVPAMLFSVFLEFALGRPFASVEPVLLHDVATNSLVAPVIEELAKGFALLILFFLARNQFDSVLDGIVYGAVIGFGFAMTENALYFFEVLRDGQVAQFTSIVALRSLLFGLNHAFYTAIIGAGFGLAAELRPEDRAARVLLPAAGLALAIAFHAVHNLGIMLASTSQAALLVAILVNWGGVALILVIVLLAWRQERRWITSELRAEVGYTLSPAEYEAAASYGYRLRMWLKTWRSQGWRAARRGSLQHHLVTRLAFLKHRLHRDGDSAALREQIAQVRAQLAQSRR
ncbi:MAG: PrsW family intramembrane metalloprotease [Anaerolineae bacterium]